MEIQITDVIKNLPMYLAYLFSFILLLYIIIKKEIPKIKCLKKIILTQIIAFFASSTYLTVAQYLA
ncbi:MAG: hypothetical protein PHO23_03410, partial [Candidatus Pacebacteria bacterium]|nr:hypothetical protein [Candidatus Paceibacterota bacterium]